ncbi:putative inorganic phosphate cotransporter [Epargyreus clarus]|uniref:putative inorganic phosphate cotransporter n=1 Tax=Epargyreus clarus TaxID=520877 RepID=UPI003C2DA474
MTAENDEKAPKVETLHVSEETEYKGLGYRHQQCFLLFLCLTTAYSMRAYMGVSLVAMTGSGHDTPTDGKVIDIKSNFSSVNASNYETLNGTVNDTNADFNDDDGTGGWLLAPPFPKFKWDKKTQDTIQSSFFWGYMALQIPAGQLVHRFGSRYLLSGALLFNCVLSILLPWAAYYGGWALISVCRVAQGLSQACILPGIHTFLGKWSPVEERGRLSALIFGGQAIGTVLGIPITGFIASSSLGWPGIFRFYGVLSGITGAFVWWLCADTPSEHKSISEAERRYIEEKLGQRPGKKQRPVPWGKILRCRGVYAIVVAHIGTTWGQLTLYSEVPAFMDKVMGVNIRTNGLLTALPFLVMWFSNFFFSWLVDMFIVKNILSVTNTRKFANTLGSVPAAIGLIALAYAPKEIYIVETILIIICCFKISTQVGFQINHIDISPNYSGTLMSISNFASNSCASLAPLVAGFILTDVSDEILWRKVFFVAAGLYLFTNLVYVILGTSTKAEWDDPEDDIEEKQENEALKPMLKQ